MRWVLGIVVLLLIAIGAWYVIMETSVPATTASSTQATTTAQTTIIPGSPNETYADQHLAFTIQYPATASTTNDFSTGFLPLTATPVIGIELPASMFAGTNLAEAGVYIGATTSPDVMTACTDLSKVTGPVSTSTAQIGGQNFVEVDSTDAGAGNVYQQKTFRAFQNGSCLEIVELLHSADIGNYPSGTVQPFDQAQFQGILDAIVRTYQPLPTGE